MDEIPCIRLSFFYPSIMRASYRRRIRQYRGRLGPSIIFPLSGRKQRETQIEGFVVRHLSKHTKYVCQIIPLSFWIYPQGVRLDCLRAVRLVVVYHPSYRLKYAKFVKPRNIMITWASTSLSIVVFAVIYFATSVKRYRYGSSTDLHYLWFVNYIAYDDVASGGI